MRKQIDRRDADLIKIVLGKRLAGVYISEVEHFLAHHGVEWTCNRLKAIRTASLQAKAGNLVLAELTLKDQSISYKIVNDLIVPKGMIGKIAVMFQKSEKASTIRKWDAMLRFYTVFRLDDISDTQLQKMMLGIGGESTADPDLVLHWADRMYELGWNHYKGETQLQKPNFANLKPFTASHRDKSVRRSGADMAYSKAVSSLLSSVWIPESLVPLNEAETLRQSLIQSGCDFTTPGHISVIQEPGCKARVVAVPNVWLQWLYEPLHRGLAEVASKDPNSVVFNQNAGAYNLVKNLLNGSTVACFDLSSATDRFPLEVQLGLLRGMGLHNHAQGLEEIRYMLWDVYGVRQDEKLQLQYKVGQPMGLYGSFPLFHITHSLLLRMLCRDVGADPRSYLVLGDDVVISDLRLAEKYQLVMRDLGVSLSPTKSITSDRLGEFAGFVAYKRRKGDRVICYRPYKWRSKSKGKGLNLVNKAFAFGSNIGKLGPDWLHAERMFRHSLPYRNPDLSPIMNPFEEDDSGSAWDGSIGTSQLSSLVNQVSYGLSYDLVEEFHKLWYTSVYILLDKQYMLEGQGLDLTSDPRSGGHAIDEGYQSFLNVVPTKPELKEKSEFEELSLDPAVRWSELDHQDRLATPVQNENVLKTNESPVTNESISLDWA